MSLTVNCEICGRQVDIPFNCRYCGGHFCAEHRIPESHSCPKKPSAPPAYVAAPSFPRERTRKIGTCPKCHHEDSKILKYNAERAIFKCWHCGLVYGQKKSYPFRYFRVRKRKRKEPSNIPPENVTEPLKQSVSEIPAIAEERTPIISQGRNRGRKKMIAAVLIAVALIAALVLSISLMNLFSILNPSASRVVTSTSMPNPTVTPSQTSITIPALPTLSPTATPNAQEQQILVNYALSLINSDRQASGLQNVTLSTVDSAQEHADDMLKNGYVSHWDMNGYKPYMRYTLAGGQGAVAENIGWVGETGNISPIDVESTLKSSEWGMIYNDSASNWGHRDNILNPLHNQVSIGIAYNNNNVYFVEDFINNYISWNILSVNDNEVTMQGTLQGQQSNVQQIEVFYDNPQPLTVNQLNNAPYQDGYDQGTYVSSVLPQNWQATSGITITADTWNLNGNSFQISFSLSQAIASYGSGVYTIYLYNGSNANDDLTTYSVWIR